MGRLSKLGFIDTRRTGGPPRRRIRSRGVPTALIGHEIFCTDDPDEARELVGQFLGPSHLEINTAEGPFQATMNGIRLRDVTLAYLDFHTATKLTIGCTGDHYSVHMPMSGRARCMYDEKPLEALSYLALVVNPGINLEMAMEFDSPQLIVRIEVQALERQLARMLGRTVTKPVVFDPAMDLTTDPAVRWHGALQLLSSEVMTPNSLVQQGIGAGPIEELVISSLLWVQPSNVHEDLMAGNSQRRGTTVRRAIAYMEENLSWAIGLPDIAKALDVSVRSVQKAFHDDLGTTPMNYLRDRRLERVRAELADAVPSDGVTVTEVAERWGFGHLGNFSAIYRKRFGESPSETLRR
ncbi:AraC family transcriptional regulator [Sporichthya brevicatena]|uniref:AraC family transcriptional regulator n=1 Tax=Sporichthya brevicatena TaxID=171442 RepID=A0ABN1GND0_9ACTN